MVNAIRTASSGDNRSVVPMQKTGTRGLRTPYGAVDLDQSNCAMLLETEALLLVEARAEHVGEVPRPALKADAMVGFERQLAVTTPRSKQQSVTGGLVPVLRVLHDLAV